MKTNLSQYIRLLLDGIVQHDVYHIGQIGQALSLIRSKQQVSTF